MNIFFGGSKFFGSVFTSEHIFAMWFMAQVWRAIMASVAKRIELELWPVLQDDETISCTALTWPKFCTSHSFMSVKVLLDRIFFDVFWLNFQLMKFILF